MERRQYHSDFCQRIYNQGEATGEARGEARGEAKSILLVLEARGIPVSDAIREKILQCTDTDLLAAWVQRAAVASTAASVVRARASSRAPAKPRNGAAATRARSPKTRASHSASKP
jgi:hypothetical protein